jgi:PAS domain S-box-containing protein
MGLSSQDSLFLGKQGGYAMAGKKSEGKKPTERDGEWRTTFNSVQDAICLLDVDYRITQANDAMLNMVNMPLDDVLGRRCWELVHGTEEPIPDCPVRRMKKSLRREQQELAVGDTWLEVTVDPILNQEGELVRAVHTIRDITQSKQGEAALLESEDKFRYVFESANIGKSITLPTGEVMVNKAFCDLLGYGPEELRGKTWQELTPPEEIEPVQALLAPLLNGDKDSVRYEKRYLHKNGSAVWVDLSVTMRRDSGGKPLYFIATIVDITDHKRAEKILRESEESYRRQFVKNSAAMLLISPDDGRIVDVNTAAAHFYGFSHERMLAMSVFDLNILPAETIRTKISSVPFDQGAQFEFQHRMADGTIRDVEVFSSRIVFGNRPLLHSIIVDRTERKRAEETVRASEKRFRRLFDDVPISLWEEDFSDVLAYLEGLGFREMDDFDEYLELHPEVTAQCAQRVRITAVNKATLKLHEAATEDELMEGLTKTFTEKSYEAFRRELIAIWNGELLWGMESEVKTLGGETRHVVIQWSVHADYSETLSRVFVSMTDVTKLMQGEEEREKLDSQLQQAQKMESIGRLAGGVAHDFNNMLTAIRGFSDLVYDALGKNDPLRDDIAEIQKATDSAAALTQQLLTFSRKQIISPRIVNINKAVAVAEKMLRRIIGEDIDLIFVADENIGKVKIDPSQIDQILVNLAVNARDAIPGVGMLTIETKAVTLEENICPTSANPVIGDCVMLAVRDTGKGMDATIAEQIFEPFFTTKEKGKGTGLGLSTVHGIVLQNNGHINVYSEPEKGTTFKIYLPAVHEKADAILKPVAPTQTQGQETILLVEDQETVRKLAARTLQKLGYDVIEASHGGEALIKCENLEGRIDLLLTDVVMPEMGGKELHERLLKIVPDLRVLYMSGYTENAIAHHGVLDAGTNFIQKPFRPQELAIEVRRVLDKH